LLSHHSDLQIWIDFAINKEDPSTIALVKQIVENCSKNRPRIDVLLKTNVRVERNPKKSHVCKTNLCFLRRSYNLHLTPPPRPPSLLLLSLSTPKPPTHLVGEWFGAKMSEKDWLPRHAFSLSHTFTLSLNLIQWERVCVRCMYMSVCVLNREECVCIL
jgi:hypothetical protein